MDWDFGGTYLGTCVCTTIGGVDVFVGEVVGVSVDLGTILGVCVGCRGVWV